MTVTLDSIREAADAAYGSYDIEVSAGKTARLLNALRIPADKRNRVTELQKAMGSEDADQVAILRDLLTCVAETPAQAKLLITAVGDDLAVLVEIFKAYGKATQVGEASASRD